MLASSRLLRHGTLLKSATALERFAQADMVVFDKTGTLTEGRLILAADVSAAELAAAAGMAKASRHPLARALAAAAQNVILTPGVEELPGCGLRLATTEGEWRLGRRDWAAGAPEDDTVGAELWLARPDATAVRFGFVDRLRNDAVEVVAELRRRSYAVALLSGDRAPTVRQVAGELGVEEWYAACTPAEKTARLEGWAKAGRKVLMVGDGLNDAPALAAAHVSLSPSSAVDIAQTTADAVFQGSRLAPVLELIDVSRRAERLVKQNFALSFSYNVLAVPFAILGYVTPLVAAVAMSSSSLLVVLNSLRMSWQTRRRG